MSLLPVPARIPIGTDADGRPVTIHKTWLDFLTTGLFERVGGVNGVSTNDNAKQFEEYAISHPEAQEALRAVDELRNEIASVRSAYQALQSDFEQIAATLAEMRPADQLLSRVQSIEDRLA